MYNRNMRFHLPYDFTKFMGYKGKIVRNYTKSRYGKSVKKTGNRSKRLLMLTYLTTFVFVGMVLGTLGIFLLFVVFSADLPNPYVLLERSTELSTKLYDRNGTPIFEVYGEKNRQLITLENVSPNILHATLSVEDSNFYQHQGFDFRGMIRALMNTATGEGLQGGSTLTQQVVKNVLLTQERTLARKVKELILSLQLENKYSKDEIIQMYLNETPYGGQNYGILTASRAYFNKDPKDLSVAEAAYLAGLPQRPSYYSHFGSNPEAGLERKDYVLYLMNERGWISSDGKRHFLNDEEYELAKKEELNFQSVSVPFKAPHFVFYVKQQLAEKFGEEAVEQGGLQVTTSIDLELQEQAQQIVYEEVENAKGLNVGNGGLVAIDPKTGQILSMVGSKGYFLESEPAGCITGITGENSCLFEPNLNVTTADRQPGSAIKPITYATMLSKGYTAAFPLLDVPTSFEGSSPEKPYIPENYDGKFRGPMPVRKALGNSLNIPAVKALKIVGIDSMIDQAEKMGISTLKDRSRYGLALTLGGGEVKLLELSNAFAVFANGGVYKEPISILEVKDSNGRVLYKWRDNGGTRVLSEEVAFLISDILSDDGARSEVFGFGSLLNIPGHQVAVKTGTTDDKRDNYAIGFNKNIVIGTWVGNNNNDAMNPYIASGITGATPVWNRTMTAYLKDKTDDKFSPPKNVQKWEVDSLTGMQPFGDSSKRAEWFVKGTEPTARSTWYEEIEICKVDGKIANDECKDAGETEVKTFVRIQAELPEWQSEVDKWVYENFREDDKYFPPTTTSHLKFDEDGDIENENDVFVDVVSLSNGDKVGFSFRLSVEVSAANDISEVRIYDGDNQVTADESYPYGYNFSYKSEDAGEHEFSIVAEDEKGNEGKTKIKLIVGY